MKWILACILWAGTVNYACASNAQFSKATCEKLAFKRAVLMSHITQKSSYSADFSSQEQRIFVLLHRHCKSEQETNEHALSLPDEQLLNAPLDDMTYAGKLFMDDKKQMKWQKFYVIPQQCREKGSNLNKFVWCSHNKSKQKKRFELIWQSGEQATNEQSGYSLVAMQAVAL
ncbi:hypothetical protein [Pseudoalteromonas aurantia]|uniref:Uncharacterized protein n=1 Tax=Pseudoalteromonas aurantia TaxID=43654 RepID=A0ABY2W387_9GAMM|nr:hypothetical protein [Pseudoalteromonas aurantia]TMO60424.1 hypothetical protein CWC18_13495 [Pseudoalteromonas aurantia]TMO79099.1 hypothetical protein CWC20_00335 [Pseudoalteromonas aurantia]